MTNQWRQTMGSMEKLSLEGKNERWDSMRAESFSKGGVMILRLGLLKV